MKTEKKNLNFYSRSDHSYNCNFTFQEFQACLSKVHKSSPGPDNISYIMLLHLTSESQSNLLYRFNRIWNEHCFPASWQEAIIIPIPKPGKDITNPLYYHPIALTSCLSVSTTPWGADRPSMLKIYKATILSKLDYGCQINGSSRKTILQKFDPIQHAALRLYSGAFRTFPVESLYVDCFEPVLNYRRQMLSLHYYFKIKSNAYHPFHNFKLRPFLVRLQEARKSFIPVFFSRVHNILTDLNLLYVHVTIQPKRNFPSWKFFETHVLHPYENFNKSNTAVIIYQQTFIEHREHYNNFVPIYTDGSKSADQVSFAVVFPSTIFSFRLHHSCSIFIAEITDVLYALEEISKSIQKMSLIYTDSLSVLKSLDSVHDHTHPLVFNVLYILEKLASQCFIINLCWISSHVGILGNEQAEKSATFSINGAVPVGNLKKHIKLLLYSKWQAQWNVETGNMLHAVKPTPQSWPSLKNRKADTILTRLRVGHTRFTHRHLLLGEQAPMCSRCNCTMSVQHILAECSNFNSQRLRFFLILLEFHSLHYLVKLHIFIFESNQFLFSYLSVVQF
ncbi:hypothetical protein AVEN_265321-1 [Araneus ventricosus]|uniref:RNase H type-1 domain-containing protein n=1 Tax=Araneus ventricosus TaxID=182803 RepID=A0A4Y2MMY3_ARAVE|nr:hypothetical protein AVEN_265321-1 [Araneus ventricosus]